MIDQTTNRSTDSVDSVFVTCFEAGSGPGFAMFWDQSLSPIITFSGLLRRPLYVIDCNGISWLIGVTFDLQYGYTTILVCNLFTCRHGHYMACCRLS